VNYLLLIMTPPVDASGPIEPVTEPDGPVAEEFMAWQKELEAAGVIVDGRPLDITSVRSVSVRRGDERIVTDGPFAESREIVGGYVVIDVPDLDSALDWAGRCPGARYGSVQVREVWTPPADF
jgi:hypothetical protein